MDLDSVRLSLRRCFEREQSGKEYMEQQLYEILEQTKLFAGMPTQKIQEIAGNRENGIRQYRKGEFVFLEGTKPEKLYLLISGKISIAEGTLSGRRIPVADIQACGEMFGEVYLFRGNEEYDVHAQAVEDSRVFELSRSVFQEENGLLLQNLLHIFAGKAYYLSGKVRILGAGNLREKIVRLLFETFRMQGVEISDSRAVLNFRREDMADFLNVTRPSLSRELGKMKKEGLIEVKGRAIFVRDTRAFEEYL